MNIVKGVTDLIRRTSGGQTGESGSSSSGGKFSAPSPRIRFGEIGDEAVLHTLWQRYENAIDKVEKKKLLLLFFMHFIRTYKNWEPVCSVQSDQTPSSSFFALEHGSSEDVVVGCSSGHPAEIIYILIQEIARITALVTDLNTGVTQSNPALSEASMNLSIITEGLHVLDVLTIIIRSMHNCRVFSYYGGVQKLTALMKAAVVQLKTLFSTLAADEVLSQSSLEKTKVLQKILIHVVSVIHTLMDFNSSVCEKSPLHASNIEVSFVGDSGHDVVPLNSLKGPVSEARFHWQQKAITLVMEAGGLNWLVELLRVIRRLNMKAQWTEISLQYLTLVTLRSALSGNPRAQNHFRSIGGLEVLLDGLGLPSSNYIVSKTAFQFSNERNEDYFYRVFHLQILSLEVLRESTFGNLYNLQFLCENGRVHKFANSICWPAFMVQEFQQQMLGLSISGSRMISQISTADVHEKNFASESCFSGQSDGNASSNWSAYAAKLSQALCSFLLTPEDIKVHQLQGSVGQSSMSASISYWELAVKWFMKVLFTLFPCIKACSNQTVLPSHIRILSNTLQHYILFAFRKLLISSATLFEVFRQEGIWDLIFSESFFYFKGVSEEISGKSEASLDESDIIQMEVISFLEFAATLTGNTHNVPECSALLDALEQSSCNPEIASVLVKSLHRILQLSNEQTISSFKTLGAIARILKVACIQAEEFRKLKAVNPSSEIALHLEISPKDLQKNSSRETAEVLVQCMAASMEIFTEFVSVADNARSLILHNTVCIDCLFDLFWEEGLREDVLQHILDLMKLDLASSEDHMAKLYLCCKYLETFNHAKEREKDFVQLSIDLLVGMRDVVLIDPSYYQDLFCDGECFLHIVSLLNGILDEKFGEQLVLNVLETLTFLLSGSDVSKGAFKALVGAGYQTLQNLLLDICHWQPTSGLLDALLDMLVDGKFSIDKNPVIKNEDVIILFFSVLQKSSESLRNYGLDIFQRLLKDSISNRTSCVRAGMLSFLLDWFPLEVDDGIIMKISQLIQIVGGHSISGKDIRRIFALLRSEKIGSSEMYCTLLLNSIHSMLKDKGPTSFFDFSGVESGIVINTPVQWPYSKGFSFSCWIRVEKFPEVEMMDLFHFLTDNGRGCSAMLGKERLTFESVNQKRQMVSMYLDLVPKKWHFLCITHSIGRAFSGGSMLRCYVDGNLVSTEKCRYAKINDLMTHCTIGKFDAPPIVEENSPRPIEGSSPFIGQIGPIYMFGDALSSDQIKGIYYLGPNYMYSFHGNEVEPSDAIRSGIFDAKDGLASKIIFGLNAQASDGRNLFNVSSMIDHVLDKNIFEAKVMAGTQLCSRRLLQQIIYCVGGVSVFFPLLTQFDGSEEEDVQSEYILIKSIARDKLAAEVIELVASVLDGNLANQQQMHLLSGFSIIGFLFQSVPPEQLNIKTVTALKHMLDIVRNCGLSELLMKDAISKLYLNPHIWVYANYDVQRDLYMFLIKYFENDARLLTALCGLPRIIDIIRQFYWDKLEGRSAFGSKPLLHPTTGRIIGERPGREEIHKIRLLLLSLVEMSLRQEISASDIKTLVAFFEKSQDMVCIEDVLHMVIRALSQKELLASFIEQVNMLGGGHIFVNVLGRELEPIRLLGLQFIGKLLVGLPSEKKGQRFFNLTGNRSKSLTDSQRKANLHLQAFYQAVAEKLFKYPLSDHLCATLFDVLLGGASPKQVLQKRSQSDNYQSRRSGSNGTSSHFFLPQILVLIFKFLGLCEDSLMRKKVLGDLLNLLDSNPSNIEALMEYGWNSWLETSLKFGVFKNHKISEIDDDISEERNLVRNVFSLVLSHYMYSIKGGYLQFEEAVNFLLLQREQGELSSQILLRTIIEDLIGSLVDLSSDENIFVLQPCRDNTLYLLKLADEMLISELGCELLFPISSVSADHSSDFLELERQQDIKSAIIEALNGDADGQLLKQRSQGHESFISSENHVPADQWWKLYDKLWVLICAMNGKGPSKIYSRTSTTGGPSFGQRARGLVESLNIPAAEMAAVVVSGSIGNALGGKTSKGVDKAMLLRGEKCPRIIFRLVILYLSKSVLERASKCVQQFISLLPCLLASDDEHSKSRLHLFIWSLLATRKLSGMLDDGARFQLISHLIRETVNFGKSVIATSILGREDSSDASSSMKEISSISNLIQKERLLVAVVDEVRFMKTLITDRSKQLQEFHVRMDEVVSMDIRQRKMFDDENCINLDAILSSDDSRRVASQLAYDEDQQIVAEKWIHMFRALIDERGPWSAYSFPNEIVTHWKLDKTEDLWRRRPKLRRNYHFDKKLCHPPTITCNTATHLNESHSGTGSHFPEQMKHFLLKGVRGITEEVSLESVEDDTELSGMTSSLDKSSESEALDVVKDSKDQTDTALDRKDQSSSTAETEFSNEVLLSIPSVLITPKRKLAGRLAVMRHVLHFFGEFLVEGTGGSSVFKNFSDLINHGSTKSEQLTVLHKQKLQKFSLATVNTLPDNLVQDQQRKIKRHRRWNVGKIKAVHWTRYLLQYTAIEIFFHDSVAPVFLNFASLKDAKDAGMLIVSKRNELLSPKGNLKDKNGAISFIDRRIAVEMAENARESWRRREMSNFEYLMVLNTLAGRSYNDLTQYPVFPWVLADYSSEKLDFNKSSTFRDLSKPVGALDIKRFEVFEDRYHNFCDPDIPSFYYGSHYSSMGIVLYYLLRLEPFTALHRTLQGGKFDHADRLFQSIEGTYRNCLSNTSDVKELIPEFFYMPEFLTNSNSYHLGVKQDGEPLCDVSLPPWAKGSLEEFIYKNRDALESEYVSSNLHHWIDLVFGYKQRGKPAVEAANIFYYLTYEGAVDMDAMEDESQRLAIEDQIANFGQTPIQIFRKKHPRRGPPIPIAHPLYFAPASITLTSMISISSSAILYIGTIESNIVFIDQGLTMSVKMWLSTQMQSGGNFTFSGSQEPFFGIGSDVLTRKVGIPLAENIELGAQCFTTLQTPTENFMVLCGNWENSFQVISLNDGRMVQNIRQHKDVVSCLAVSSDGSVLATGSYDTTVMVWEVSRARMTEKRFRNAQSELPRRDYVIVENPVHILCGHDDIITCLYVSVELDIVISGSRDGTCIFHTLRDGKYVRSIRHPSNGPLSRLAASQHGRVVFYADNDLSLHMYSINGKHIATSESNGRINCVAISSCGEFLVCAGDHGHIFLRSMHSLDIVKRYEGVGKIITSLTVTPEECFLAGTKDGNLLIYSIENPQLRRGSLQRNMKSKSYATG